MDEVAFLGGREDGADGGGDDEAGGRELRGAYAVALASPGVACRTVLASAGHCWQSESGEVPAEA